jgi:xanthine/CO dehydrogenase XdhC/CoxF family maturation factor
MTAHAPVAARPRVGVVKFASCDGCQLTLLDLEDELLSVVEHFEIVDFPEATSARSAGPYDVLFVEGSVSGGCIEDDIVARVRRDGLTATKAEVVTYGVSADEARRFGLPCGGTIELVLEPLTPASGIGALLREIEGGRLVARRLELATGRATLEAARAGDGVRFDGEVLTTIHGPRYRMLVIGASQLSKYLAQMAQGLDYQVTVCDPRSEYA